MTSSDLSTGQRFVGDLKVFGDLRGEHVIESFSERPCVK